MADSPNFIAAYLLIRANGCIRKAVTMCPPRACCEENLSYDGSRRENEGAQPLAA